MTLPFEKKVELLKAMGTKALENEILAAIPAIASGEGNVDNKEAEVKYAKDALDLVAALIAGEISAGVKVTVDERKRLVDVQMATDPRAVEARTTMKGLESLLFAARAELGAKRREYQTKTRVLELRAAQITFMADAATQASP